MVHTIATLRWFMFLLAALPLNVKAQGVEGTVRGADERPLSGATVTSAPTRRVTFSDSLGHYRLNGLPIGHVILTVHAPGYRHDTARAIVQSGRLAARDFVLQLDAPWTAKQLERWLSCAGAAPTVQCTPGRHVESMLTGFTEIGAWSFRDSVSFRQFWLGKTSQRIPPLSIPRIDWNRENVVAVSYGRFTGCGPRKYVNRIERHADTTVVVVGPDSLYDGPPQETCMADWATADFTVIPRAPAAIVIRGTHKKTLLPGHVVDVQP
jgi:hypothetical protein